MKRLGFFISKSLQRHIVMFASIFLVLLSSCAIKSSIKNLVSENSSQTGEHKTAHKSNFSITKTSSCSIINATEKLSLSKTISLEKSKVLPVFLSFAFAFFLGIVIPKNQEHSYYNTTKISGAIPIFLRYEKLII